MNRSMRKNTLKFFGVVAFALIAYLLADRAPAQSAVRLRFAAGNVAAPSDNSATALTNGVIGFWKFDQGTSASEPDLMTGDNSLTVSPSDTIPYSAFIQGDGRDFETGDDDYMYGVTNRLTEFGADTSFTVGVWLRAESIGVPQNIVRKSGTFSLTVTSGNLLNWTVSSVSTNRTLSSSINIGTSTNYFVVAGHNATNDTIYVYLIDPAGIRYAQQSYTEGTTNTGWPLYISANESNTAVNWDGLMADLMIFNRSIPSNSIVELYNNGSGVAWPWTGLTR